MRAGVRRSVLVTLVLGLAAAVAIAMWATGSDPAPEAVGAAGQLNAPAGTPPAAARPLRDVAALPTFRGARPSGRAHRRASGAAPGRAPSTPARTAPMSPAAQPTAVPQPAMATPSPAPTAAPAPAPVRPRSAPPTPAPKFDSSNGFDSSG
jgi:hypothetical protein